MPVTVFITGHCKVNATLLGHGAPTEAGSMYTDFD